MFLLNQTTTSKEYYEKMLKAAGSLSHLFSESAEPYLGYRLVENLFCRAFGADNLSRSDTSIDASKESVGIGIKTFIYRNGRGFEKIAEFNRELDLFKGLEVEEKIIKVAELRNERVDFARRTYNLTNLMYHCVARDSGRIIIYETPMPTININNISGVEMNRNTIKFFDGMNHYGFNISKSTLYKQFYADSPLMDFPVKIIDNPFDVLEKLFQESITDLVFTPIQQLPNIFLPLYSVKNGEKYVAEKSGLNQWNAGGRARNLNEVYIPIPAWLHHNHPNFFPNRDVKFSLQLPNKELISAKLCQDNSKALMSDPNAKLGEWILRDVMQLQDGELLTYDKLETLGLDSVVIYKLSEEKYKIDFAKIGSFDSFIENSANLSEDEE
jgi:hypothetical protein